MQSVIATPSVVTPAHQPQPIEARRRLYEMSDGFSLSALASWLPELNSSDRIFVASFVGDETLQRLLFAQKRALRQADSEFNHAECRQMIGAHVMREYAKAFREHLLATGVEVTPELCVFGCGFVISVPASRDALRHEIAAAYGEGQGEDVYTYPH